MALSGLRRVGYCVLSVLEVRNNSGLLFSWLLRTTWQVDLASVASGFVEQVSLGRFWENSVLQNLGVVTWGLPVSLNEIGVVHTLVIEDPQFDFSF